MEVNNGEPISEELKELLNAEGYFGIIKFKNKGICAIHKLLYTTGIVYNIDSISYEGRYCYNTLAEAVFALGNWDGNDDPPGDWIVHKSRNGNIRKDGSTY